MTSSQEQRIENGKNFTKKYKDNLQALLNNLQDNQGLIEQEALLKAFNNFSAQTKDELQKFTTEGITIKPAFSGPFYSMINGQDEPVKIQVKLPSGNYKETTVNPRLLFWKNSSPIHTHLATKPQDLTPDPGEALCAFSLAGGVASEAKFALSEKSEDKDFVYKAHVKKVTLAQLDLTVDRYKTSDANKPLTKIYTHQFVPQENDIQGIYILNENGEEQAVKAITSNLYNGVKPTQPAHSQKVQDSSPEVTQQAFARLADLKSAKEEEIKDIDPSTLEQLGVTGFEFAVRVKNASTTTPTFTKKFSTSLLKSTTPKFNRSATTDDLPQSHREKVQASKADLAHRI